MRYPPVCMLPSPDPLTETEPPSKHPDPAVRATLLHDALTCLVACYDGAHDAKMLLLAQRVLGYLSESYLGDESFLLDTLVDCWQQRRESEADRGD